jgi:hypothetical protein
MTCEFVGRSLTEGKKTFHSISTNDSVFVEAGMSLFSCDDIYEKFAKLKEKGSTKIFPGYPFYNDVLDMMENQAEFLGKAANHTLLGNMTSYGPDYFAPVFMQFDVAKQAYVEMSWSENDPTYGVFMADVEISGRALYADEIAAKAEAGNYFGWAAIDSVAFLAQEYNLGILDVSANDDEDTLKYKNKGRFFINGIQTSLSGCLQWTKPYQFVFGEDGTNDEICTKKNDVDFEMRIFDSLSPKNDKKKLVLKGPPTFNFIPSHAWGTQYAGNVPEPGPPGYYPAPEIGGEDNPKNQVTAELDVYYNPSTGKAEAGTRQILARLLDDIPAVKINNVAANIDEITIDQLMNEVNSKLNYFSTGYAMPVNVHKGNPYMFGPTFTNKGKGCTDEEKEKLLVTNRSQKSYEKGRIVLLQRIDDEWIPMDFGEDDPVMFSKTGNWNFQYLIADKDSYFKDDRHYYEEQFQPELTGSITPAQYESLYRYHFYSTMELAINDSSIDTWDNANDPSRVNGRVSLPATTVYPTDPCSEEGQGEENSGTGPDAARIEAENGVWVKTETSSKPAPGCFTPSDDCNDEGGSSLASTMPGQPGVATPFSTDHFLSWLVANEPDGLDPLDIEYNGKFVVDSIGSSNFSQDIYPTDVYEKTEENSEPWPWWMGDKPGGYTPFGARTGPDPATRGDIKNVFNCTMGCRETQEQRTIIEEETDASWLVGNSSRMMKETRCVDFGFHGGYINAFAAALFDHLNTSCAAAADAAPQVKTFEYQRSQNARKFVGSRRYLNVTSFDMLSSHWNGNNAADWLGTTNPSWNDDGSKAEDPTVQPFYNFHPFWGALFTDGYTEESVKTFMANRQAGEFTSKVCSNNGTGAQHEGGRFGYGYLRDRHFSNPPVATNVTSYARKSFQTTTDAHSLDSLFTDGDINLAHLPADIGTNASPNSGLYGTPIVDFRRMVNLVNVVVPGTGYDPTREGEEPKATDAANTVDWGNDRGTDLNTRPLALNTKTYFSETKYKLSTGEEFSIPDRAAWVSKLPRSYDGSDVACVNGNSLGNKVISKHCRDSFYDLEPASAKITFMPLTAEWIGAFDRADNTYQPSTGHRAAHQPWHTIAYDGLNAPQNEDGTPTDSTIGAGWYWADAGGTNTYTDNITVKRLSLYPMDVAYADMINPKNGTFIRETGETSMIFPGDGGDKTYVEIWSKNGQTFGGKRGDPIFRIGRNNGDQFKAIGMSAVYQGNSSDTEGGMGGETAPADGGSNPFLDYEFLEVDEDVLIPLYKTSGGYINQHDPSNGLVGSHGEAHIVELVPGFPFDGYVRHRTDDYSVFGPRDCWGADEADAADCVGIITSRATIGTNLTNLICTLEQTRGLPVYTPNTQGQEFCQWGAKNQDIQNVGSEMLFARVFEAWPETQTLFDARYFAVMHFNPGLLLTNADTELFEYDSVEYLRYKTDTTVDLKIPTLKGTGEDTTAWDEIPLNSKIASDGAKRPGSTEYEELAPYDLWRVSTVRRGMLLPFNYASLTIGIDAASIIAVKSIGEPGVEQRGTGFEIGDTLTFQGGSGSGAQIRVAEIDVDTGAILSWTVVDNGKDYLAGDFVSKGWSSKQGEGGFSVPQLIAVPDAGVTGKDAYIAAPFGAMYLKDETDEAPNTSQNAPVKISKVSPRVEEDPAGRDENNTSSVALPLYGANGSETKFYDVFLHYHNDITSTIAYNKHEKVSRGLLKGLAKVQYMKLELSTR